MSGTLFISPKDFFKEAVRDAFHRRRIETLACVEDYLVQILVNYVVADRLKADEQIDDRSVTLAESLLKAVQSDHSTKIDLLKKLGDRTLYTCGFFGDSLQRKIIDVDYCIEMGGTAYALLAESTRQDTLSQVYSIYSRRFLDFVDALNYISEKAQLQSSDNVLRVYERYLKTGSDLAREKLHEMGIVPISKNDQKKVSQS